MQKLVATPAVLRLAVLDYLNRHPEASDTLEGIAGWWLPEHYLLPGLGVLQATLDEMIQDDLITDSFLLDGRVLYALKNTNHGINELLMKRMD